MLLVILAPSPGFAHQERFMLNGLTGDSKESFIHSGARCGFEDRTPAEAAAEEAKFRSDLLKAGYDASDTVHAANGSININIYFHIITSTTGAGAVSQTHIVDQMNMLNDGFKQTTFMFSLVSVTTTTNDAWFNAVGGSNDQSQMKNSLRMGDASDLNIYTNTPLNPLDPAGEPLLGYATFPDKYANNPIDDGVVVLYSTLPGGTKAPFNLGDTLIHEVGHWLGLYHTFQGDSCSGDGDFVGDTPFEESSASGCPIGRDTCPDDPGLDPINNFMDYSDDECLNHFTEGQKVRMDQQWKVYRAASSTTESPATSKPTTRRSSTTKSKKRPKKPTHIGKSGKNTKNSVYGGVFDGMSINGSFSMSF